MVELESILLKNKLSYSTFSVLVNGILIYRGDLAYETQRAISDFLTENPQTKNPDILILKNKFEFPSGVDPVYLQG